MATTQAIQAKVPGALISAARDRDPVLRGLTTSELVRTALAVLAGSTLDDAVGPARKHYRTGQGAPLAFDYVIPPLGRQR